MEKSIMLWLNWEGLWKPSIETNFGALAAEQAIAWQRLEDLQQLVSNDPFNNDILEVKRNERESYEAIVSSSLLLIKQ